MTQLLDGTILQESHKYLSRYPKIAPVILVKCLRCETAFPRRVLTDGYCANCVILNKEDEALAHRRFIVQRAKGVSSISPRPIGIAQPLPYKV